MRREESAALEARLRTHYGAAPQTGPDEVHRLAALCAAEARRARAARPSMFAFLAVQARFVRPGCWLALAACLVCAALVSGGPAGPTGELLVMSLTGLVLSCVLLAGLVSDKGHHMMELEGACVFNAHAVACARLAILGCASALTLLACALFCSATQPLWLLAAHAAAPYFVSCAGGLLVARRTPSPDSLAATTAWTLAVCAACAVLHSAAPGALQTGSEGLWYVAAALSAVWCAHEVTLWLRHAARPVEPAQARAAAL